LTISGIVKGHHTRLEAPLRAVVSSDLACLVASDDGHSWFASRYASALFFVIFNSLE
jgi:hypothetical protein